MLRLTATATATLAVSLGLATGAQAQTTPPAPVGPYYFECQGAQPATKVQNHIRTHTWSLTKPAASFQSGAGCGYVDPGLIIGTRSDTQFDASFGGTHAGEVQTMDVELHNLVLGRARLGETTPLKVRLLVDGVELLPADAPPQITVVPVLSSTGVSEALKFSITNLRLPALADGSERRFVLDVGSPFFDSSNAFVWGASEIAANVVMNPVKPTKPNVRRP